MKRFVVILVALSASFIFGPLLPWLYAEEGLSVSLPIAQFATDSKPTAEPEPYRKDEFPPWLQSLRRGEILFFGALPISFLLTDIGYGLIRFAVHDFEASYTPTLFGGSNIVPYTDSEKYGMIAVSISLSAVLATVDYFIGRARASHD